MSYKLAGVIWNDDGTLETKKLSPLEALEVLKFMNEINGWFEFDFSSIEKSLKALEIVKEKRVDIYRIQSTNKVGEYNFWKPTTSKRLKKEEYDLLKEVLL